MLKQPKHILIVDDEPLNCELLEGMLESMGHASEAAHGGADALTRLDPRIDLVLLDVMMPVMDGFETARQIRVHPTCADVPIIIVTALSDKADRLRAVEAGANDFIAKPVDQTELYVRTKAQLAMKEAQDALKRHQAKLEETVSQRTIDLRRALHTIEVNWKRTHEAHLDTIHRLALAAEYKDEQTAAHIRRVSHYCALLARRLDLPAQEVDLIFHASPMHDVGKIGIPDAILHKPGKLTPSEWDVMKQHTTIGARILEGSNSDVLEAGKVIALSHHEKWDGGGYPRHLVGENIPLHGRICAVADVFDALTSKRHYKEALPEVTACEILRRERGMHFDPQILDVFLTARDDVRTIRIQYPDDGHEVRRAA